MVAKFDYFHIGYATATTAIKFSFFVQVISLQYFLTVFNFPDFPRQRSFPGVFSGLVAEQRSTYMRLTKITYVLRIVDLFHRQGRV